MGIPDYQTLMLPLLEHLADGQEHASAATREELSSTLGLTEEERRDLLPSGQSKVANRIAWTKMYLRKAGLIDAPSRGVYVITERGKELLRSRPSNVNNKLLLQYPEFVSFLHDRSGRQSKSDGDSEDKKTSEDERTPEEALYESYERAKHDIIADLMERVSSCSPEFFERLVVDVLVRMGYGGSREDAAQVMARGADGGIDGMIKEDPLGIESIYVQAKRWEGTVGRPELQKFAGALQGQRARKGVFITTSSFTSDAQEFVRNIDSRIILIDGDQLALLMFENDVGLTTVATYFVKRIDTDYFIDD